MHRQKRQQIDHIQFVGKICSCKTIFVWTISEITIVLLILIVTVWHNFLHNFSNLWFFVLEVSLLMAFFFEIFFIIHTGSFQGVCIFKIYRACADDCYYCFWFWSQSQSNDFFSMWVPKLHPSAFMECVTDRLRFIISHFNQGRISLVTSKTTQQANN